MLKICSVGVKRLLPLYGIAPVSARAPCIIVESIDAQAVAVGLPEAPEMEALTAQYEATHAGLQLYVTAVHSEWFASVDPALIQGLSSPLLTQVRIVAHPGWARTCVLLV